VHADSINFKETQMLAYDYPLLGLFWTMMIFFLWVAWLILLFRVFADIFRSKDMGGFAKAIWSIFVILVPFLGVFLYVIVNGRSMSERDIADAKQREAEFQAYVRETAGTAGSAEEIAKLADLRDKGVITDEEFASSKAKLLA
jgi:heme exporter protein D